MTFLNHKIKINTTPVTRQSQEADGRCQGSKIVMGTEEQYSEVGEMEMTMSVDVRMDLLYSLVYFISGAEGGISDITLTYSLMYPLNSRTNC